MAETVYTKVLQQAAEIEGSAQSLASSLRVPENTLQRWMSGRAQMPLRAFLKAMDVVAKHEVDNVSSPSTPPASTPLRFSIGRTLAECASCGSIDFRQVDATTSLKYTSELACTSCGAKVVHGNLVVQLAKEVSLNARSRFAAAKKREAEFRAKTQKTKSETPTE